MKATKPFTWFAAVVVGVNASAPDGAFKALRNSPSVANGLALFAAAHADWITVPVVMFGSRGPPSLMAPPRSEPLK